jgi:hypothetical protein
MAKKTIYRSVIKFEILSDEPIPDEMTLGELHDECDFGSYSGIHGYISQNKPIKGIKAVHLIKAQGSDPEFFGMDENGNDLDDSEGMLNNFELK